MNRYGPGGPSRATATTMCQKCLKRGHYSYECTAPRQERPYISRPSRTQQLLNPKLAPQPTETALQPKQDDDYKKEIRRGGSSSDAFSRHKRALDDRFDRNGSKRPRSKSSSSFDSVSTISTSRSRSPSAARAHSVSKPDRRSERDLSPHRRREPAAGARTSDRYATYPSKSSRTAHHDVRGRSRRDVSSSRSRDGRDWSRGYSSSSRSRSRSSDRGGRPGRYRSRSRRRSRSPVRDEEHGAKPPRQRVHDRSPPRRLSPVSKQRSLSPYSRRVALTKAANAR